MLSNPFPLTLPRLTSHVGWRSRCCSLPWWCRFQYCWDFTWGEKLSCVNYCLLHYQFKQYLTHNCYLQCVFLWFHQNLQVYIFGDVFGDEMIHLDEILGLTGLVADVVHGAICYVLYVKYSILWNEFPHVSIGIVYYNYFGLCFQPSWFLGSLQEFLVEHFISMKFLSKISGIFSVAKSKSLIPVPNV